MTVIHMFTNEITNVTNYPRKWKYFYHDDEYFPLYVNITQNATTAAIDDIKKVNSKHKIRSSYKKVWIAKANQSNQCASTEWTEL